jgi:GTP diphosphokinase / guanosine-3',5'-bis(diphosphate) 3'-diphosphatase
MESLLERKLSELIHCSPAPLTKDEIEKINQAYSFASKLYSNKKLANGKPYILHNLNVAITAMKEIGLGPTSAICSLLHGEQTSSENAISDIKDKFGDQVAEIVEGFNQISSLQTERISYQSEAFRKLYLSIVNDIRVILIKLAHRLNDIRNIDAHKDHSELIIEEIKHIYSPIAHRLGLYKVKTELEERVMKFEDLEMFNSINQKIKETKTKREVFIKEFIRPVERELMVQGIDYDIKWRTKSVPSIYNKMRRQNVDFEEVYDLFAIRIILKTKPKKEQEICWKVYSIVTNIYEPNPKRLRDWITVPKASGYESLHTTVLGANKKWVEVQIRTKRMDDIAEKGQAAHWQYKGVMSKKDPEDWLNQVRDILQNPDQIEFDFTYKPRDKARKQNIYVFTPKGDLKQLKPGSTILDFAYEIHTDVGSKCNGARVNNKVVPIRYTLQNGDKVDIITSKNQKPKLDWLAFVNTEKARSNIRKQMKEEKYREAEIGKEILARKLKNWKIKSTEDLINMLVKHYKLETAVDLYYLVAEEKIELAVIKKRLLAFVEEESTKRKQEVQIPKVVVPKEEQEHADTLYIGENLKNVNYRLAKCCNPIRGDHVFGFVTTTGSITVHRKNCPNAKNLFEKYPYRVMDIKWLSGDDKTFTSTNLRITGSDELGVVSSITRTITDDLRVNMRSVNFQKKGKHFEGRVVVMVKDHDHLDQLVAKLNQVKGVEKVVRVK